MSPTFAIYLAAAAGALYFAAGWRASRPPRAADPWIPPVALIVHLVLLTHQLFAQQAMTIGFNEALSLFTWQSALLLWLFCLREPLNVLGVVLYPLAGAGELLATFLPSAVQPQPIHDWKVELHVVLSLLSAGLLTLAAAQALALAVQDRLLHRHQRFELLQRLPPLQTMEQMLFQLIALGFILLSITLISAAPFVHDLIGQHLAHKAILSVVAWVLFAVLLWGRRYHGWRGRVAIRWALSGYALLILAYFGSKWVLEELLHRQWT